MDHKIICKTMLYSYKDLEEQCKSVDNLILRQAIASKNRSTEEAFERIMDLTNEKIAYCNIKVIIDEAVAEMKNNAELKSYYILGWSIKKIEEQFNLLRQTLEWRLTKQREELYKIILSKHNGPELIEIMSDSWFLMKKYKEFKALEKRVKG